MGSRDFTPSPSRYSVHFSTDDGSSCAIETIRPIHLTPPPIPFKNRRSLSFRKKHPPLKSKQELSPRLGSFRNIFTQTSEGNQLYLKGNTLRRISERRRFLASHPSKDDFQNKLDILFHCDQFFIERLNIDSYGCDSSTYEVRNGKGQVIFRAVESILRLPVMSCAPTDHKNPPVELSIFDLSEGEEILNIKSSLGRDVMLVYVKLTPKLEKFIGTVRRTHRRFLNSMPAYHLESSNGITVFKIQSLFPKVNRIQSFLNLLSRNSGKHFKILLVDEVTCVGNLDKEEDNRRAFAHSSFPIETPIASKAMLLAATFFQHTNKGFSLI